MSMSVVSCHLVSLVSELSLAMMVEGCFIFGMGRVSAMMKCASYKVKVTCT